MKNLNLKDINLKNLNPKVIGIIIGALVILFIIGLTSSNSEADKKLIAKAKEEMANRHFDSAESALAGASGKKAKKLHSALYTYQRAETSFYNNYGITLYIDKTDYNTGCGDCYEIIKDIDSAYKKYPELKKEVNELKDNLKKGMEFEKDLKKDYKKMKSYYEDNKIEQCEKLVNKWAEKINENFPVEDNRLKEEINTRLSQYIYEFKNISQNSGYTVEDWMDDANKTIEEQKKKDEETMTGNDYSDTKVD